MKYEIEQRGFYVYSDDHGERRTIRCFDTKHDADLYADRLKVYGGATRILRARKALTEEMARREKARFVCPDCHIEVGLCACERSRRLDADLESWIETETRRQAAERLAVEIENATVSP